LSYQIFDGLNEFQEKAVKTIDSPLLVIAGPGTGKTLTIVRRIVYLIQQGARPEDIHAVTFTNRVARDKRERAAAMLGNVAGKVFIGTFHVLGLRIIIHAWSRFLYGQRLDPSPSPFLREIPEEYIQVSVVPDSEKKQKEKDS
jgi:UvrD/REP helicase N-terminal domain